MATNPIFSDVAAWPEANSNPAPAPAGHNKPPLDELIPLEFKEELLREHPDFLSRMADYVGAADRAKATNDDELARCGNLVKAYRDILSHINKTHTAVKEPYLKGGRLVDAEKNALIGDVEAAKRKVEGIGNAYVAERKAKEDAERARIEAEQRAAADAAAAAEAERAKAERDAAEALKSATSDEEKAEAQARAEEAAERAEEAMAAAALAPALAAKAEPVRSDEGATVSGKQDWMSKVEDYEVAFMSVSDDEKVREAIDKAIQRRVKAGTRKIEGVRIWPVAKANFR